MLKGALVLEPAFSLTDKDKFVDDMQLLFHYQCEIDSFGIASASSKVASEVALLVKQLLW